MAWNVPGAYETPFSATARSPVGTGVPPGCSSAIALARSSTRRLPAEPRSTNTAGTFPKSGQFHGSVFGSIGRGMSFRPPTTLGMATSSGSRGPMVASTRPVEKSR